MFSRLILQITFLILISLGSFEQGTTKIDPKNLNKSLLHTLFLQHLNKHRDSLGLLKLSQHSILDQAAKDQTDYMVKTKVVGHTQTLDLKKGPSERVLFYRGNFNGIGENCLCVNFNVQNDIKGHLITVTNYDELAKALFLMWRYSPGHYANMITPDFKFSGIDIEFSPSENRIYSANVFAMDEYIALKIFPKIFYNTDLKFDEKGIYKDLTNTTFAISTANFTYETCKNMDSYNNKDSIGMHYYDIKEIREIIKNPTDGLMIDFVIRDQFTCKSENILDFSPVYDGWPKEPVFTPNIYSKNKSKNKEELDVNICEVPAPFFDSDFQANVILVKNKLAINYTIPLSVPQADFDVMSFQPLIDVVDTKIMDTTFVFHFTDRVYFKKGTSIPQEDKNYQESLLDMNYLPKDAKIIKADIVGYSSIEGDSLQNHLLQQKRVDYLKNYLLSTTSLSFEKIQTKTSANKSDFYINFGHSLNLAPNLSLVELNKIYQDNKLKINEDVLSLHRYSELNYDLELSLNNFSSIKTLEFIYYHIDDITTSAKTKLLKVILSHLQKGEEIPFLQAVDFRSITNKNLLLPLYFFASDSVKFREMYNQNKVTKKWNDKDKFNFVIANYKYFQTYNKTFINLNELNSYINIVSTKVISDSVKNLLWLNYYLIKTKIYYDQKNAPELKIALGYFKEYYFKFEQDLDDILMIGKFFNQYSMFDWTLDLLSPKLETHPNDKELWFTYANTYTFARYTEYDDEHLQMLITHCKKLDKTLFCKWINEVDFQLLRNPIIKANYCNDCEKTLNEYH